MRLISRPALRAGSLLLLVAVALILPLAPLPRVARATVVPARIAAVPVPDAAPGGSVVRLPWAARFVVVSWVGDHDAVVRLAPSGDGLRFAAGRDVGRDGVDDDERGRTWSSLVFTPGAVAVRVSSDRPLTGVVVTEVGDGAPRTVVSPVGAAGPVAQAAAPQPNVVSRSEWGADESLRSQTYSNDPTNFHAVQKLIVHHTGDDPTSIPPTPEEHIRAIYRFHTAPTSQGGRGWSDIAYNFLVSGDGRVFEGRYARAYAPGEEPTGENLQGRGITGAHAANYNSGTVGIAMLGNFVNVEPTQTAVNALVDLLAWKADRHGIDPRGATAYDNPSSSTDTPRTFPNIAGHRDVGSTTCPGGLLYAMLPSVRDRVAARIAGAVQDAGGRLNTVEPARLLDTRVEGGAISGGSTRSLAITGRGGVPVSGVRAVVLNVTAIDPTRPGFLTVFPGGSTRPTASNLNFVARQVVPNLVTAGVGRDGTVSIYNSAGETHVAADVVAWYGDSSIASGAMFAPVPPARLLDTRGTDGGGSVGPGEARELVVAARGGVPGTGADAVVLNVTAITPTKAGFVTVYPAGTNRPGTSNLNLVPGQVRPNLVLAKVGSDGRVLIYNNAGQTHLAVDVVGWFGTADASAARGRFTSLTPARALDTRESIALGPNESRPLTLAGIAGVPPTGAGAVLLNVTVDKPTASGFLTVHPTGGGVPVASNLNFRPDETVPNAVVVGLGDNGSITLTNASGTTHVIVDVVGWYSQQ